MIAIDGAGFSWLEVPEETLLPFDSNHFEREATESFFAGLVRATIDGVRQGDLAHISNIPLLISSLRDVEQPRKYVGFGSWNARIGKVLGLDRCRVIGARVCKELHFTLEEAYELHEKFPHEDSFIELLALRYKPS
jgi:hypothetical protein